MRSQMLNHFWLFFFFFNLDHIHIWDADTTSLIPPGAQLAPDGSWITPTTRRAVTCWAVWSGVPLLRATMAQLLFLLYTFTAAGFCSLGSCWGKWFHLGSDLTEAPLWGPPVSVTETGPLLLRLILSFCYHFTSSSFVLTIADLLCGINTLKVDLMIVYIFQNVA